MAPARKAAKRATEQESQPNAMGPSTTGRKPPKGKLIVALMTLLLGALLLYLALPRTLAFIIALPGDPALTRIQEGAPVADADLETLIAAREKALLWAASGRFLTDLALARLVLAQNANANANLDQKVDLKQAATAVKFLRDGLAKAPANPYAWTRLAYAELISGAPPARVATALRPALRLAPYDPRLFLIRLDIGFFVWPALDADDRALIYDQIRMTWAEHRLRGPLIALVRGTKRVNIVRTALLKSLDDLVEFEKRL